MPALPGARPSQIHLPEDVTKEQGSFASATASSGSEGAMDSAMPALPGASPVRDIMVQDVEFWSVFAAVSSDSQGAVDFAMPALPGASPSQGRIQSH